MGAQIKIRIGDSKVLESRETPDGTMIRRRRVSSDGKHRFTTYERVEMPTIMVEKSSGHTEPFDRDKLLTAVQRSVGKFFESQAEIEEVVEKVIGKVYELGEERIRSRQIGHAILDVLAEENEVAYVRFASVFLDFKTLSDFENILKRRREAKK